MLNRVQVPAPFWLALCLALGPSMWACSARDTPGDAAGLDTDAAAPDRDAAGPDTDAATADVRSTGFKEPSCLTALFSTCRPSGTCVEQHEQTDAGRLWGYCYASGVKVEATTCSGTGSSSDIRVFKPDGTLCYTVEQQWGPVCESSSLTWKDATGRVVAVGDWSGSSSPSHRARCADSGEVSEALVHNYTFEPIVGVQVPSDCTPGSCP